MSIMLITLFCTDTAQCLEPNWALKVVKQEDKTTAQGTLCYQIDLAVCLERQLQPVCNENVQCSCNALW